MNGEDESLVHPHTSPNTESHNQSNEKLLHLNLDVDMLTAFGQGFIDSLDYSSYNYGAAKSYDSGQVHSLDPFVASIGLEFRLLFLFKARMGRSSISPTKTTPLATSHFRGRWTMGRKPRSARWEEVPFGMGVSTFLLCCEGQNNMYPAMLPRIKASSCWRICRMRVK